MNIQSDRQSVFEINDLGSMISERLDNPLAGNPLIYIMDGFYKNPDAIVEYLQAQQPQRWKANETPSNNGVFFDDFRHTICDKRVTPVYEALSAYLNEPAADEEFVLTNMTRFNKHEFNAYQDHYWWPHEDIGNSMTAIVYLNRIATGGTNLYLPRRPDENDGLQTHLPWRKREKWHRIKSLEARYNRLVIFPSGNIYHGACVDDETFFGEEFRLNQVMFFR